MPRRPRPDFLPPFIRTLIKKREESGLSRPSLAKRMGYTYDALYGWETGTINPELKSMLDWCEYFDMDLEAKERRK